MEDTRLWKYCTKEQCQEFILSLGLLPGSGPTEGEDHRAKQLACLYMLSNHSGRYYRKVELPKKDGGFRTLMVPCGLLKSVQRRILHHVLDGRSVSPYANAYCRGSSIRTNALPHLGREWILKLDIKHFFDSIVFPQVRGAAFPETLFPPAAAVLLTNLCCYQDRLPQGAPTSPAISNLVMKPFDKSLGEWCVQRGVTYTRYCDDMTFSGGDCDPKEVYGKARNFLQAYGFELNQDKTRLIDRGGRQLVTGVVVNEKLQVPRQLRRKLRQEIHYCLRYGIREHVKHEAEVSGQAMEAERYAASMAGRIQFVLQINPQDEEFQGYKDLWEEMIRSL